MLFSLATAWASFAVSWMTQVEGTEGQRSSLPECPAPSGEAQASPPKTHAPVWNETEVWPKSAALSLACLLVSLQAAQCWQNQQKLLRLCLNNPSKAAPLPNPEAQDTSVHPH